MSRRWISLGLVACASCSGGDAVTSSRAENVAAQSVPTTATTATTTTAPRPTTTTAATTPATASTSSTTISTTTTVAPVAGFACTPAPADADALITGPTWQTGDRRELLVTADQQGTSRIDPGATAEVPVTLTVTDADGELVRLLWEADEPSLLDVGGRAPTRFEQNVTEDLFERLPRDRIEYAIDNLALVVEVDNVEEIRANLFETAELIRPAFTDDEYDAVIGLYESLSDDDLIAIVTGRLQAYHLLEGYALTTDDVIEYEDRLANFLGGEPFPATTTVRIVEMVDADGCVLLEQVSTPDPAEFSRILAESLVEAGLAEPEDIEEAADAFGSLSIETVARAQFDFESGLLWRFRSVETVSDGIAEETETLTILDVTEADPVS